MDIKYLAAGDSTLVVEFGDKISTRVNERVRALMNRLEEKSLDGIVELVPTYRSLAVHYDPMILEILELKLEIYKLRAELESWDKTENSLVEVPVLYGGEYGPDIESVANHSGMTVEEVIKIHSSRGYLVHMLGFTPGFPYLGGMDERIATPRLETPRARIKGGSVGIAGAQTGIYPVDSPGGWQIIGSTPLRLFCAEEGEFLFRPGDTIKFVPIDLEEYKKIEEETAAKTHYVGVQGD